MSTHRVQVVRIEEVLPHPNAGNPDPNLRCDMLEVVNVGHYACCVRKGDFKAGDLAVYIQPDYVVPQNDRFAFLKGHLRIRAKKLKGCWSQGLLLPAEPDMVEGENVMERWSIIRYEPGMGQATRGMIERGPNVLNFKYDVENWYDYDTVFTEGEEVIATEKIHGKNARFCFAQDDNGNWRMYAGTRNFWLQPDDTVDVWACIKQNPWIETFCAMNPGVVLYGECFGWVQKLRYGAVPGQYWLNVIDLLHEGEWISVADYPKRSGMEYLQFAPLVYRGPFDAKLLIELAEGTTQTGADPKQIREGLVVKAIHEKRSLAMGRVIAKIVSKQYLAGDY
jgi:RNA ligase (TIGR02306 family)